jgi:hypothetical protein
VALLPTNSNPVITQLGEVRCREEEEEKEEEEEEVCLSRHLAVALTVYRLPPLGKYEFVVVPVRRPLNC